MGSHPDVLIVGAGVFGISVAHHLADRGVRVRVLERDRIGGATSTCAAGFIGMWAAGMVPELGPDELVAEAYATQFYTRLYAERPQFEFRVAGMVFIALDAEGWTRYIEPIAESDAVPGIEQLSAQATAERAEIVDANHIFAGVYHPGIVQLSARDAVQAMAARAREQAVQIDEHTPVADLVVDRGKIAGVRTERGEEIQCDHVVLATAMWTNSLLRRHAAPLAYAPMGALRITTEPLGLPSTMPMLMVTQVGAWLREEGGGLRWGCLYRGAHRDALLDRDPPERVQGMPMDGLRETEAVGRRLSAAIPPLARYRKFTYIEGYPCYTPDKASLLGPVPEVEGLFAITGDGENGVTHGPGYGRALAESIMGEEPEIDMSRYRLDRFSATMPNPTAREVADLTMARQRIFQ